ncbi:lamin tail domain-containing protein [Longispora albida]|uniref:lamin tail domain-containing protein n=1 Tax=Longispora albida TaxID=203523 RepID=UPI0003782768|nr:lamin tail domain-containing protein [Longispora albida]
MRLRRPLGAVTVLVTAASSLLGLAAPAAAAPADLIISEYVEGSSNNKAIELYNGTGSAIDLAGYSIQMYFNGAVTPGATVNLTGSVASGDVFVLAHASAAAAILAQADQTSSASFYNGDDAIVLRKGGAVVDSIGQVGTDPGTEWGTGLTSTADNTLRRTAFPDTDPADAFDPAAQWSGFAADTFDGLGSHATGGGDLPAVLTCGGPIVTPQGSAATRDVSATDADDTIVDLAVTGPAGVTRSAFTPATADGGVATATIAVDATLTAGSYPVTVTTTDDDGTTATCGLTLQVTTVLTVGEVQGATTDAEAGKTDRSPLAPASGNGTSSTLHEVRGVITQKSLAKTSAGANQYGFYLQSRLGNTDGNADSSDGIFVFMGGFTTLIGGYEPKVGDEVVVRARVSEYFNMTQLSGASLVRVIESGLDVNNVVAISDTVPPADLDAAYRFWERHEGARMRVRGGSVVTAGRDVFGSTADSEIWLVDKSDPLATRTDPYARRVFRDTHALDNDPSQGFDDGNGQRIMLGTTGVKAKSGNVNELLAPARTFDLLDGDALGAISYSFEKYGVQAEAAAFTAGTDPAANHPVVATNRSEQFAVSTYNVENLYDFRDDPFDGCDFTGNTGCPGVRPPFDYVPATQAEYDAHLQSIAKQIIGDLHSPDLLLIEEAEDQDICTVANGALVCGTTDNADGKADGLQELALAIAANGGPAYDTAYDRDGADARGIVAAFLYRTDRLSLSAPASVLTATPGVEYRAEALPFNAQVSNPKSLNAVLPADVDTSTGKDGNNVYTRAPQVGRFTVAAVPGESETFQLWAVANHFSSTPDGRVGQRREQARYGAQIVKAIQASDPGARVLYGGDLNVFPRPDDPVPGAVTDQLAPLYDAGMKNLWDVLAAENPASAYSYVFQGQAQTLDHIFVTPSLYSDLVRMRAAHVNADYPAEFDGDGIRGVSDHDPQVATFGSRARLSTGDASVLEGNSGTSKLTFTTSVSRPVSEDMTVCAVFVDGTTSWGSDHQSLLSCSTLTAGATSLTFTVNVKGDKRKEADEWMLAIVVGDLRLRYDRMIAVGTILNDD